jgi:guanine deaminase
MVPERNIATCRREISNHLTPYQQSRRTLYYGPIIQSRTLLELDVWPSAVIAVEPSGIIAWIEQGSVAPSSLQEISIKHGWDILDPTHSIRVVEGRPGEWLMPGLVDTHTVHPHVSA